MRICLFLILALSLVAGAGAETPDAIFRNGLSAFNAGTYPGAQAAWGPLAEAGDARAQAGLGYMYYSGQGVPRDTARAADLFQRAADQGEPTAQLFLALMYFHAEGVPKNASLALMWLELAITGGQAEAFEWRGTLMQSMTEAERSEGWRLLARWRVLHAPRGAGR
jgi:uncharacterized protein